ncbi:MAG TPA: extracellular solute-binding protein [Clostridia bacterium]|nr:extracellular solute-binding protein [Clostridia bacterium]
MLKKLWIMLLIIITGFALWACSAFPEKAKAVGQVIRPEEAAQEISIIFDAMDIGFSKWEPFENYKKRFQKQYGVKVNCIAIGDAIPTEEYFDNLCKELAVKLLVEDGPELIFYSEGYSFDGLVKQKAVLDVRNKIDNIDSIYAALVGNELYCVPVTISYRAIVLNHKALEALDIKEPELGWDKESYYDIKEKWLDKSETTFSYYEYNDIINKYLRDLDIFNVREKRANINTPQMKDCIKKIRAEIFSGKYNLKSNYKFENYYNMMYEYLSDEYKEDSELRRSEAYNSQVLRNRRYEYTTNPLKAKDTSYKIARGGAVVLPQFSDETSGLAYAGFLINRNGKNTELACEFINGLLSKEVQMQIYEDTDDSYPVNKELEGAIRDIEAQAKLDDRAVVLKDYVLDKIKSGSCKLWTDSSKVEESELFWKLVKDLAKCFFADKTYTEEELAKELQKLEGKYNIWLNE